MQELSSLTQQQDRGKECSITTHPCTGSELPQQPDQGGPLENQTGRTDFDGALRQGGDAHFCSALGLYSLPLMVALPATAQSYSIVHTFGRVGRPGWVEPVWCIADSSGNFYGTTQYGGALSGDGFGYGTVYELPANGGEGALLLLERPMEQPQLEP